MLHKRNMAAFAVRFTEPCGYSSYEHQPAKLDAGRGFATCGGMKVHPHNNLTITLIRRNNFSTQRLVGATPRRIASSWYMANVNQRRFVPNVQRSFARQMLQRAHHPAHTSPPVTRCGVDTWDGASGVSAAMVHACAAGGTSISQAAGYVKPYTRGSARLPVAETGYAETSRVYTSCGGYLPDKNAWKLLDTFA